MSIAFLKDRADASPVLYLAWRIGERGCKMSCPREGKA